MKILFLDVDGVLNSARFFNGRKWSNHVDRFSIADPKKIETWTSMLDPDALRLLDDLLLTGDLDIVISSSWREVHPLARIRQIIEMAGELPGHSHVAERIIDRTDIGLREEVIPLWVSRFEHEIEAWAVLDDMALRGFEEHFVRTTWADGLQPEHITELRRILER